MIIAFAAQKDMKLYQLDVKSVFLYGELKEDIFNNQKAMRKRGVRRCVQTPKGFLRIKTNTYNLV